MLSSCARQRVTVLASAGVHAVVLRGASAPRHARQTKRARRASARGSHCATSWEEGVGGVQRACVGRFAGCPEQPLLDLQQLP